MMLGKSILQNMLTEHVKLESESKSIIVNKTTNNVKFDFKQKSNFF